MSTQYIINNYDNLLTGQTISGNLTVTGSFNGYSSTTVNISSAQILAMGTTPIELLPAPGVGMYYEYEGWLEYTHNTTAYGGTFGLGVGVLNYSTYAGTYFSGILVNNNNQSFRFSNIYQMTFQGSTATGLSSREEMNQPIVITTESGNNPTLGDGTLRAIITYTLRTFGA